MTRPSRSPAASSVKHVIVLACSARQLGAAARRGGYVPLVADVFGDSDTRALAGRFLPLAADVDLNLDTVSLVKAFMAFSALAPDAPVVWGSGLEPQVARLTALAGPLGLTGTAPETLALLTQPRALARRLRALGIPSPPVHQGRVPRSGSWLRKRIGGAGGAHVQPAAPGTLLAEDEFVQAQVTGRSLSVAAVLGATEIAVLGFAEHLFWPGENLPFRYGGALALHDLPATLTAGLHRALEALATSLGLRGLCGVDFILGSKGDWHLVEINPRPTATFDLHVHAGDAFRAHLAAARGAKLPGIRKLKQVHAHAVWYAPAALGIPNSLDWPAWISDRPPAGSRIAPGAPVCTLRAAGGDANAARAALHRRLVALRAMLGVAEHGVPNPRMPSTS